VDQGLAVKISVLDRSGLHLPQAGDWNPRLPAPTLLVGDALAIPLEDRSVDVVSCCLFLHHLSEDHAHAFLKEALRVSRVAVLVNDLERTRTNYLLSRLQTLIDPSELSRHDGPASVRQAYTFAELTTMLKATGCGFELQRGFLFRLGAILWRDSI
jgi:ubiquinone/menaquinone biosynthesis C-methylase UbiE